MNWTAATVLSLWPLSLFFFFRAVILVWFVNLKAVCFACLMLYTCKNKYSFTFSRMWKSIAHPCMYKRDTKGCIKCVYSLLYFLYYDIFIFSSEDKYIVHLLIYPTKMRRHPLSVINHECIICLWIKLGLSGWWCCALHDLFLCNKV